MLFCKSYESNWKTILCCLNAEDYNICEDRTGRVRNKSVRNKTLFWPLWQIHLALSYSLFSVCFLCSYVTQVFFSEINLVNFGIIEFLLSTANSKLPGQLFVSFNTVLKYALSLLLLLLLLSLLLWLLLLLLSQIALYKTSIVSDTWS